MKLINIICAASVLASGYCFATPLNDSKPDSKIQQIKEKGPSQVNLSIPDNFFANKDLFYKVTVYKNISDKEPIINKEFKYTTKNEIVNINYFNNVEKQTGNIIVFKDIVRTSIVNDLKTNKKTYLDLSPLQQAMVEQNSKEIPNVNLNARNLVDNKDNFLNLDLSFEKIPHNKFDYNTKIVFSSYTYDPNLSYSKYDLSDRKRAESKHVEIINLKAKYIKENDRYVGYTTYMSPEGLIMNVKVFTK